MVKITKEGCCQKMKPFFLKNELSKKSKIKCSLLALMVGFSIIGIASYSRTNSEKKQILSQNEAANILSIQNKELQIAESSYFLEENPDPAISVFEQFDYVRTKKESKSPKIQQLKDELEQLAIVFEKEKKQEVSVSILENLNEHLPSKKERPIVQQEESDIKEDVESEISIDWQNPQIILSSSYLVINQHQVFEPSDYFKIIPGNDLSPKITHNLIDTSKLGEQKFSIQVTDSRGNSSYSKIDFFVNSAPTINLKQSIFHQRIDQPIDLLQGVTAFDHEDGDLTTKIKFDTDLDINKEGVYGVTYLVADRHGAKTMAKAVIKIINDAPVIHVPEVIEHKINHRLDIFDYIKVTDTEDGLIPLNESNIIETNFDFKKEGNYFFKIGNVKDSHGKVAKERSFVVQVTNEAPKIIDANIKVNVFTLMKKEDYLQQIIVSDREDAAEDLKIELDESAWEKVGTTTLNEYIIPIKVTDTNGKTTNGYGKITVINEPPKFIGVVDRELMVGDKFDPLAGITVYDKEEDLSLEDIKVIEKVDTDTPGTYIVRLKVSDSFEQVFASYQLTVVARCEKETGEG